MSLKIHTSNLVKKYSSRTVVNQVSVSVEQGQIVGLLGPNGAGKTTTFYMVVGLIRPDLGDVFLNETNITRQPMYKRAQMGIGYLPQEASVFRKLSVEDNIMAVLEMTKLTKKERQMKTESLLEEFHLMHVRKNNGDSLSGGERRRTEIARALAVDPKFILLDEPFAGVDPIAVEDIQTVVARLKYKNIGILITDHNVNETLSICDRAYLLIDGTIFRQGTAPELAEDEQVRRLYLGTNFELKRKDWIIDMERDQAFKQAGGFSLEQLISVVERGISDFEHYEEEARVRDRSLGGFKYNQGFDDDDLQINERSKFLEELRVSVIDYGAMQGDNDIQERGKSLFSEEEFNPKSELQSLSTFLKLKRPLQ